MDPAAPEEAEAFATICVASLSADGDFSDIYRARLYDCLRRYPGTAGLETAQHTELLRRSLRSLHRHGADTALRAAAKTLSGKQREETFAWACEMAVTSGKSSAETRDMVQSIRAVLDIPDTVLRAVSRSAGLRFGKDNAAPVFTHASRQAHHRADENRNRGESQ